MRKDNERDGGYYAIKGFTYQFDKTILEILENPNSDIELEQIQDVGIKNYYIQIKHKETQDYAPSKIKNAVLQLFSSFLEDKTRKFRLYCYFKNRSPLIFTPTVDELNSILGERNVEFDEADKKLFLNTLTIEFSENFDNQFRVLIKQIKNIFNLTTEEESTVYHASIRSNLIDIAIKNRKRDRIVNLKSLKKLVTNNEKVIFELAHCRFLKNEKYIKYLKSEYFTFKKVNIPNKERLFILEVDLSVKDAEIIQIVSNCKNRYYRKNTSPAPVLCFYNIEQQRFNLIKQRLWDIGIRFNDGTRFNGDKFGIEKLLDLKNHSEIRFISLDELPLLLKKKCIDEPYMLSTQENDIENKLKSIKDIKVFYIAETRDIIKVINP